MIGRYVYAFRQGKANQNLKGSDLEVDQISRLKTLNFIFDWEVNPILNPRSFEDYVSLLKEMQKAKDKTGCDINDIRSKEVVRINKINDDYEFEYFANREEAEKKCGKNVETIGIGQIINHFKRGKLSSSGKDLTAEQIEGLRDIGLMVVLENERDPIMEPKSFEDYVLLLKEMQKTQDKTGRDISDIRSKEVVRITKINDEYAFEYFANREEVRKKYGEDVETIGIGLIIYWFKRGKSRGGKDLTAEQIKKLRDIGLKVVSENERDPIMKPKSFEDYVLLLKEMQNTKNKTGRYINDIRSREVVRITKINDEYEFEYFANKEEANSKYGEDVEIIGIGLVICSFKRGKSRSGKDLTAEQIEGLRNIGLSVVPENERDHIMEPQSFDDYILLLKEIQNAKDKTGRDINSIKQVEVVRITKINDEYEFEYFANREEAKKKYGEDVEIIGIGTVICSFKRGKSSSGHQDLTVEQIKQLKDIGFKFNKGIEDKIYKQEICMQHNIDLKINDKIIERISKIELISKINYLEASNLELVDSTGKLIDIFSMSSIDIQDKYGISLEAIIDTYGKGVTIK